MSINPFFEEFVRSVGLRLARPFLACPSLHLVKYTFTGWPARGKVYHPVDIAWAMMDIAGKKDVRLTHLQLQKMVYIAHGLHMGMGRGPLLSMPVMAWKYGPIFPSLYHELKRFRGAPVAMPDSACVITISWEIEQLLGLVIDVYGAVSGVDLSALTHAPGSPWHQTWCGRKSRDDVVVIKNGIIMKHYRSLLHSMSHLEA